MSAVKAVACDELAVAKGHVYASVFADAIERDVLFATPTREEYTWKRFADDLQAHGGDPLKVQWACMDMSGSYQAGARWQMPKAQLVFDKFHVIKLAGDAVDQVRRRESKQLPDHGRSLKGSRYIWLKNPENLTDKQTGDLDHLSRLNLRTAKAYQMRLALQDLYQHTTDPLRAHRRLKAWARWTRMAAAREPLLEPMARVGRSVLKPLSGGLAHWENLLTNAFMEGLMSVFSATKRKARGYRSFNYLRDMLYFTGSNLDIPSQPLSPNAF
jgi:transposase